MKSNADSIKFAREVLRGQVVPAAEIYELAERLRRNSVFSYARRLFALLLKSQAAELELQPVVAGADSVAPEERPTYVSTTLALKHSICTYEDPDLPVDSRFDAALGILSGIEELRDTMNPKILGLAGDIYARKWELDNQKWNLERACCYYYRGYLAVRDKGFAGEYYPGYTAIKGAFLLDRIAQLELDQVKEVDPDAPPPAIVLDRRLEAERIRRELVATLSPIASLPEPEFSAIRKWSLLVILAEACFGLGEYVEAGTWLKTASTLEGIPDNKYEKIVRRLIAVYRFRQSQSTAEQFKESDAGRALAEFVIPRLKTDSAVIESLFMGKVGLALSGSGFRASLFHIGVLAKLAELGMLRSVEVLSCSSGGSIVGTHYYLELQQLLQRKADADITNDDYIALIRKLETDFLAGVQRDLQTRSKTNLWSNFKAVFKKNYSRTDRLGELFQREIFCRVKGDGKEIPSYLDELYITPKDEPSSFTPKKENWRRLAKVPVLVLNATTLNTGHNWRFTAAWMGEPAGPINSEIDGNVRLRLIAFEDAPKEYGRFKIGRAVAACAASPDLLEPIALERLYPDMTVRLTDGGISEPLGITSLIEQGCSVVIASDGSGQTDTQNNPNTSLAELASRSHRISTSHLREAQYDSLVARYRSTFPQGLIFIHLKDDIDVTTMDQIASPSNFASETEQRPAPLTSYGVRREVQERLARIRAELDAFTDTEAYALMTSGYLITESQFGKNMKTLAPREKTERPNWRFMAVEEKMKKVGDSDILKLLDVARNRIRRIWKLSYVMRFITLPLVIPLAFGLYYLWQQSRSSDFFLDDILTIVFLILFLVTMALVFIAIAVFPVTLLVLIFLKFRNREKTTGQIVRGLAILMVGWLGSWVQLLVFDKLYLRLGNIKDRLSPAVTEAKPTNWSIALQSVGDRIDKAAKDSYESISKAINRSETVDVVSRLFEASGYDVARYPRSPEINPFQLNLDLFASKGNRRIFADVKMGPEAVDWKAASGLKTAASLLSSQDEADSSPERAVDAMLILIDVQPDESLTRFSTSEGVQLVQISTDNFRQIVESKGNNPELQLQARLLNLVAETEEAATTRLA